MKYVWELDVTLFNTVSCNDIINVPWDLGLPFIVPYSCVDEHVLNLHILSLDALLGKALESGSTVTAAHRGQVLILQVC